MQIEIANASIWDFFDFLVDESGNDIESGTSLIEAVGVIMSCFNIDNPSEEWNRVTLKVELVDIFKDWAGSGVAYTILGPIGQ
ncbi:MAG TPA: hypothetical protein VMV86_04240 [Methanosarcinales archaeon]|nr:hypothetical protein [Methanosarcinales archaeon]